MFKFCIKRKEPIYFNEYFDNKNIKIKVIDVYDGDTITAIIPFYFRKFKFKCRLYNFDSPEKKPSLKNNDREHEKYCAEISKFALSEKIMNKKIKCKTYKLDKYGRILIELFDNNNNSINEYMLNNNCGYQYSGKTKQTINYLENGYFILNNHKYQISQDIINRYKQSLISKN